MMTDVEMTDAEVRQQVERADRFIEQLRDAITATVVDPASLCADDHRRGLQRIAATLDAVPLRDDVQSREHQRGDARRVAGSDRGASDVRRWWPDAGLCGRDGVPRRVQADDRHGVEAAAAMRGGARCVIFIVWAS